jgi:RimJ/RimL family protein N-acetyltransferase
MNTELTDGTVVLRPYTLYDTDLLAEAAHESTAEVFPWLPWCHPQYLRDEALAWIAMQEEAWHNGIGFQFAIFDAGRRYLGGCGLNEIDRIHCRANLGYWVRSSAVRRGAATAATRLVAKFGIEQLRLTRIEILAAVGNLASRRVAEKSGATVEGVLRNRLVIHGVPHDAVMHSLIPGDIE